MKATSSFCHLLFITLFFSTILFSCTKDTSERDITPQQEEEMSTAIAQSETESENVFNDIFDNVIGASNEVGLEGTGVFGRTSANTSINEAGRITGCFEVTASSMAQGQLFPLRIEIDFGTGCTGRDGRTRSGKIITEYTGRLIVPGKSSVTSFENYRVDSILVEGSYSVSNTGTADARQFTLNVINAKLTKPNGNFAVWSSLKVLTQTEGLSTPLLHMDDVFTITGNSSGELKTQIFATTWESNIFQPLIKKFSCPWLSKGIVKTYRLRLTANSKFSAVLDYGDGQCDNKGLLTINGREHQITFY